MVKELERAGIPAAHVCTMTSIASTTGSNRIVSGSGIVHPLGNVDLEPEAEKSLRRAIVEKALEALQTEIQEPTLFTCSI